MANYINANDLKWNKNTSAERRKDERRTGTERREVIRFEVELRERRDSSSSNDKRRAATSWGGTQPI